MTDAPRTEAGRTLVARIDELPTVAVEWAPAHSAPYVSKYIVEPIVEMGVRAIEAEAVPDFGKMTAALFSLAEHRVPPEDLEFAYRAALRWPPEPST